MNNIFMIIAFLCIFFWISASVLVFFSQKNKLYNSLATILSLLGIIIITSYIAYLWISLDRPPMRTMAETRLLYAFFLPIIGFLTWKKYNYNWFLAFTLFMASMFLFVNLLHPEYFDKSLMPALQSMWFVPHVSVYILAYVFLAAAFISAAWGLIQIKRKKDISKITLLTDSMINNGYALLTIGLILGSIWAKEAWGHYWTWDPKETWALLTWFVYIIYIHLRISNKGNAKQAFILAIIGFLIFMVAWFGVNYLPVAIESVHTYSN